MSKLETITIDTPSGSNTMQIGSTNTATINLGVSGDTINVPAGVTIANAGTATGFGDTNHFNTTAFYAYLSASQTVTDNTESTITFNTEAFDLGSAFNTSTYSYTPPSTGYYYFEVSLMFKGNANDNLWKANTIIKKGDGSGNFSSFRDYENDFATAYGNKFTTTNGVIAHVTSLVPYKINVFIRDQAGNPDVQGSVTNSYFQGYRIA